MGLSMPLETGEGTGRSIEIGRLTVDDQSPGSLFQGNLGIVQGSDRVSLPSVDDDVSQTAHDVDAEDRTLCGKRPNFGLIISWKEWMRARLTQPSDETVQLRWVIDEDYDSRNRYLSGMLQPQELEDGVQSPFILRIPELQSRHPSPRAIYPEKQQLRGPNEESERSLVHLKYNDTDATIANARNMPKLVKKSHHRLPYPRFPSGVTKRIASAFIRSMGSQSTIINKETLDAISEATDRFFGQLSDDLGVFANHAGRRNINEKDVIAVMSR